MGRTPDRFAGPLYEEGIYFDPTALASAQGELRYTGTRFSLYDASGEYDPRSGGGGITESQHLALRQLIHFLEDGPGDGFGAGPYYRERLPAGDPFPTSEVWYEDVTKAKKLVGWSCTYNPNKTYATETWTVYKVDGASKAAEAVDTVVYSGIFEISRTRAVTVY